MTIGETIKDIRKAYGIKQKQLAVDMDILDSTIRKYESGKLNPKPKTIAKFAEALGVDPAILEESNIDATRAMIRLFRLFNAYGGTLKTKKEIQADTDTDEDDVYISFKTLLPFLNSWHTAYQEYRKKIDAANLIEDKEVRQIVIDEAESKFHKWMFEYPRTEPQQDLLKLTLTVDEASDFALQNPLNDPDSPLSDEEKEELQESVNKIYKRAGKKQTPKL